MTAAENIRSAARGARFVRADLHIHSFGRGGSYDVTDAAMTPAAIVTTAIAKGLDVVSITDHNRIGNVEEALREAEGKDILVVPGVELSTPAGHLLLYAPTFDALERAVGRLAFDEDRKQCRTSAFEVLQVAQEFGAIVIAAHVDLDQGIEKAVNGYGDAKVSVLSSPTLVALEIAHAAAEPWYTERDAEAPRRKLAQDRIDRLGALFGGTLPKIQSSDAHTLGALGRNWTQTEKLTRLKLGALDWTAFRAAFTDPEARVRIEETVPMAVPRILGLHTTGGFLDEQTLPFSDNLTCIIGGRGSGKSTALETLRAVCGHTPKEDLVGSDAWPDEAHVLYRDEFGDEYHVVLRQGERTDGDNPLAEPVLVHLGAALSRRQSWDESKVPSLGGFSAGGPPVVG
ncbi:MAG: AAA family ATPase [Deltaproteobacteria bacterium]|nr:AAA family ATPase [Deltaproteobacteria bacterium]